MSESNEPMGTDEAIDDKSTDVQAELVRLREHNAKLLGELREARASANASASAVEAAQRAAETWRERYSQIAVTKPLEAAIRSAAVGPWHYLRDVATENKWLTMEADSDGIARPVWRDERGRKADLSSGLAAFLAGVHSRTNNEDLGRCLRLGSTGGGARGEGASGNTSSTPPEQKRSQFGLR